MIKKILFRSNEKSIIDGICYLSQKMNDGKLSIHQTMKLFFFADVTSMNKTLLPIFGGTYKALKYGPIHQEALDIINNTSGEVSGEEEEVIISRLGNCVNINRKLDNSVGNCLSATSKKILDEIWEKYKDKNFSELTELSHAHPAWYRAWEKRLFNYAEMDYRDFYDSSVNKETIDEVAARSAYIPI